MRKFMATIINESKPISYDTFKKSVEADILKSIVDHFSDPVAILADDIQFYICSIDTLERLYGNILLLNDVIPRYLELDNPKDIFPSLKAINILLTENEKRFGEILATVKSSEFSGIDDLEDYFHNTEK